MFPFFEILGIYFPAQNIFSAVAVVVTLSVLFLAVRRKRLQLGFLADHAWLLILGTLLTARVAEVVLRGYGFMDFPFFWQDGGFDFYAGFIAFLVILFVLSRRHGEQFSPWLDVSLLSVTAGLIFYHLGTFAAGTAYGQPTSLPWGVTFTDPDAAVLTTLPIHPTQLYAVIGTTLLFIVGTAIFKKEREPGIAGAFLLLTLALLAFGIDLLRDDSAVIFGLLRISQIFALLFMLAGAYQLFRKRHHAHSRRRHHDFTLHHKKHD